MMRIQRACGCPKQRLEGAAFDLFQRQCARCPWTPEHRARCVHPRWQASCARRLFAWSRLLAWNRRIQPSLGTHLATIITRESRTIAHCCDYGSIYVSSIWQKHVIDKIGPSRNKCISPCVSCKSSTSLLADSIQVGLQTILVCAQRICDGSMRAVRVEGRSN